MQVLLKKILFNFHVGRGGMVGMCSVCVCVCAYLFHTHCLLTYAVALRETSLTATRRVVKGLSHSIGVGRTSVSESFGTHFTAIILLLL